MFSEVVDNVARRSGRLDRLRDIINFANLTMRELQSPVDFAEDLVEYQIVPAQTFTPPVTWTIPDNFKKLRTVCYRQGGFDDIYPKLRAPGRIQKNEDQFYYQSGSAFVFSGFGMSNGSGLSLNQTGAINIAYYTRFWRLAYYIGSVYPEVTSLGISSTPRPAVYSFDAAASGGVDVWTYNPVIVDPTGVQQTAARALVTNWLLMYNIDLIEQGTFAKAMTSFGDARAPAAYALYEKLRADLVRDKGLESRQN